MNQKILKWILETQLNLNENITLSFKLFSKNKKMFGILRA